MGDFVKYCLKPSSAVGSCVQQSLFAGIFRLFGVVSALGLLFPLPGWAAVLEWSALPDRERITITSTLNESMPGVIQRVAPDGVVVPYDELPSNLFMENAPEGAKIFKGTRLLGRTVAFLTQTPEFGFVVNKQTPGVLIIDFFPDPLGARWKPADKKSVDAFHERIATPADTPAAPSAVQPVPQSAASAPAGSAVPTAPAGTVKPQEVSVAPTVAGQSVAPVASATSSPATSAPSRDQLPAPLVPVSQVPVAPLAPSQIPWKQSAPAVPVVVTSSGVPVNGPAPTGGPVSVPEAAPGGNPSVSTPPSPPVSGGGGPTNNANVSAVRQWLTPQPVPTAPPAQIPSPVPAIPLSSSPVRSSAASQADAQGDPAQRAYLDIRNDTANRTAPLPQPLPVPVAPAGAPSVSSAPTGQQPAAAGQQPAAAGQQPAAASQATETSKDGGATAPAEATGAAEEADASEDTATPPPPGVGVKEGRGYRGKINLDGIEAIPEYSPGKGKKGGPSGGAKGKGAQSVKGSNGTKGAQPEGNATKAEGAPSTPQQIAGNATSAPAAPAAPAHGKAPAANATKAPAANATKAPAGNATVIYVDENQNPIEPPADPVIKIPEIRGDVTSGAYAAALAKAEALLKQALTPEQREELLHIKAEMMFALHKDELEPFYQAITDATVAAINHNQKSPRNASAFLRLGYMNLKLKKIPEAEAQFNILRRLFPEDENVPLSYYYWGDYYYNRNELQRAADQFQYVLSKYPDSRYAREAALGLARAFHRLGYYEQSFNVVDYIEKRWARFYLEYPPFLNMMGDVAFRLERLDYALNHYWLYANLEPNGNETDIILTRIGDIYSIQKEKGAAKEIYKQSAQRFPEKDGGLVARMRLAEEGINDSPSLAAMFSVFEGPFSNQPAEVYRDIVDRYAQSALAPLAELKLAMWYLWNNQYIESLETCSSFLKKHPTHELLPKVKEIALKTFAVIAAQSVSNGSYGQMQAIWERYPVVHGQGEMLSPESRVALAVSFWKAGKPDEALATIEPFFLGGKVPEFSEMALNLVLNIYLEYNQWAAIREVSKRVELWELLPEARQQLDYALALAAENMGESDVAAPLWEKLYAGGKLPSAQMAYATYFLAKDAEKKRELEKAYLMGNDALRRLMAEAEKTSNPADIGKIKSQIGSLLDISETAGRLREALDYVQLFMKYLPEDDPERVGVTYRLARIYKKQGNIAAWKKSLTEIVQKYPTSIYGQSAESELKTSAITEDAAQYSPTGKI